MNSSRWKSYEARVNRQFYGVFIAAIISCPTAGAEDETVELKEESAPILSGSLQTNLRLEHSRKDANVLLDQLLRLDVDPPRHGGFRIRAGVWAIEDLDGHENNASSLAGLHNTYEASVQVRLLHLYAEWEDVWGDSVLRVGRQRVLDNPAYPRIDGLYFRKAEPRWEWYVFGGARASLYEDTHKDTTAGGGLTFHLSRKTRLSIDGFYSEEKRRSGDEVLPGPIVELFRLPFPRRVRREVDSRMISASLGHQVAPSHYLFARYTSFAGESDELTLTASGVFIESEIAYDFTYRRRENLLGDRANELTGFYRILGEQNEFDEVSARVSVPVSGKWSLGLETQIRETESDDLNTANRDFQRYAIGFDGEGIWRGIDIGVNAEYWNVSGGESSFAVTGDISRAWGPWRVRSGVEFARWEDRIVEYRPLADAGTRALGTGLPLVRRFSSLLAGLFDTRVLETHENVYSVFGEVRRGIGEKQRITARVSREDDDGPDAPYWYGRITYGIYF